MGIYRNTAVKHASCIPEFSCTVYCSPPNFSLYLGSALQREEKLHQAVTDYSPVQWLVQSLYDPCESAPVATGRICGLGSKSRSDVLLAITAVGTLWFYPFTKSGLNRVVHLQRSTQVSRLH